MAEYIRRNDLIAIINERRANTCNDNLNYTKMWCMVRAIPAADVEPVRHGRWIDCDDEYSSYSRCSVCGDEFTNWEADCAITNYCPSCGAKMDGGAGPDAKHRTEI